MRIILHVRLEHQVATIPVAGDLLPPRAMLSALGSVMGSDLRLLATREMRARQDDALHHAQCLSSPGRGSRRRRLQRLGFGEGLGITAPATPSARLPMTE